MWKITDSANDNHPQMLGWPNHIEEKYLFREQSAVTPMFEKIRRLRFSWAERAMSLEEQYK